MQHRRTTESEFTRQARNFAASPTLNAAGLTERMAERLGGVAGERILDVACGPGILTEAITARSGAAIGLDLTAETLRIAAERSRGNDRAAFVRGLAEAAPFRTGAFGGATVRLALHHFEDPVRILREVKRLLRPGGRLIVLDVLTSPDPEVSALHNSVERLRDPSHTSFVSGERLTESIERAGFAVHSVERLETDRPYSEWAKIINEPTRMDALEAVLRRFVRAGETLGIDLREIESEVWFTYTWSLVTATPA